MTDSWPRRDPEAMCKSAEEKLLNAKDLVKMAEETVVEVQFDTSVGEVQDSVRASHFIRPIVCAHVQCQIHAHVLYFVVSTLAHSPRKTSKP
jgi:hypothetical protein